MIKSIDTPISQTVLDNIIFRPNPGFMRQLELFEEMGSNVDPSNDVFRKYKLGRMADRMQAGKKDGNGVRQYRRVPKFLDGGKLC